MQFELLNKKISIVQIFQHCIDTAALWIAVNYGRNKKSQRADASIQVWSFRIKSERKEDVGL